MNVKTRKYNDLKIAVVFSAVVPILNLLNNVRHNDYFSWNRFALTWTLIFSFLMLSWHVNRFFINRIISRQLTRNGERRKVFFYTFVCNSVLLILFTLIGIRITNFGTILELDHTLYFLIFMRGVISLLLIYIIQIAMLSARQAQEIAMQNEQLKTENLLTSFELLRQQVNPHFLFNSLSTLRSLIHEKEPNAEEYVLKLSEIYRQLLKKQDRDVVTLREELEFITNYNYMLLVRFADNLRIEFSVSDQAMTKSVPTFCLQTLIENCVKHNVVSRNKPLQVRVYTEEDHWLMVENNLQPKQTQGEVSGFGLSNLAKRYELLGVEDGFDVIENDQVFRVRIKLLDV